MPSVSKRNRKERKEPEEQVREALATHGLRREFSGLIIRVFFLCLTHSAYEQNKKGFVTVAGWPTMLPTTAM